MFAGAPDDRDTALTLRLTYADSRALRVYGHVYDDALASAGDALLGPFSAP